MRKPAKARPEAPVAEPPEAPLGAGPGGELTGGFPAAEPPWPPPAGALSGTAANEAAAVAKPNDDGESKR